MIRFVGMASEHNPLPESCMDKSEFNKLAIKTNNFQKIEEYISATGSS